MTPDARARLVEVMAKAYSDAAVGETWLNCKWNKIAEKWREPRRQRMIAAIAAAERAGFKWEERK